MDLAWPALPDRFDRALREAVAYAIDRFAPIGIIAAGTIVRGCPDPASDLDIFILRAARERLRVQKFFGGVPAEIFVNPPARAEELLVTDDARRITANMVTSGFVVLGGPEVDKLRERARAVLATPPPYYEEASRYAAACLVEDTFDVAERDPITADLIAGQALRVMLIHVCRVAGRLQPRSKDLFAVAAECDPVVGELTRAFIAATTTAERVELTGKIADRTLGTRGFFEWESPPS
jgi:hypothetical protein